MKGKSKKILIASIIIASIAIIIASVSTMLLTKVDNMSRNIDDVELLVSKEYTDITNDKNASNVNGTEFVKFAAFFARDIDNDGYANKLLGTCRNVNSTDVLYMDLNVLSNGYLEAGKITIESTNFNYSMSMVKDSVLKNNYISNNVKTIELNTVNAGTQKLIIGDIISNIGNDTNNYSEVSEITLTGTHISDDGLTKTPINKTIKLTVDWHGETKASISANTKYYYYDDLNTETISFSFSLNERQQELILKDTEAKVTIPELNGFKPTEVKCTNANVQSEYDSETKELTIKRTSIRNEEGIITSTLSRSNSYTVQITYPKEAYKAIKSYTQLTIPIEGYYTGYNNPNEEFKNPYESNIAKTSISIIFRETPKGEIYNFYVDFMDTKYVSSPIYGYTISKQYLLNLYDSYNVDIEDTELDQENKTEIKTKEYVVRWRAVRGDDGVVPSMIMSETKEGNNEDSSYGDKWDTTTMQEYVTNTGIYFENANQFLEEDGTIYVYNDDTNELIYRFTKAEWNNYSRNNPYKYKNSIKHIRVETSKTNLNSTLSVYHIKELEVEKVLKDFTKKEVKDVNMVYTYLTGICNIEGNIEGKSAGKVNDFDFAHYVYEKSDSKISVQTTKIPTQEILENQKIYIDTLCQDGVSAKWQNGEFLVELPKEIANMNIKNVYTNNNKVKIVAYDLFKKDDKYFVKILTENETPENYRITIDCEMASDPREPSSNKQLKLYSYNPYCNEYYYETNDTYDVNSNENTEEKVGTSTTNINLLSPTELITLETITNYDDEKDNEITIAPNVAEVEKDTKEATINISLTNNYPNTVSGVQILGKIPFERNTYILNGGDLKSEFSTSMTNEGISVPEELKEKAVIYYSEKENPSKDLLNSENGWKLKEDVQDFSKIKTYLIDLKEYTIEVGKGYTFNYVVNLPENENIKYNLASFSDHAVYYELSTQDGGKLQLSTEPNKVGVRIVKKFNFNLTKYKMNSNVTIPGVTYTLKYEEENSEGKIEEKTRILTTDNEGKIRLENLYAEKTYKLQEIKVPNTCELDNEEKIITINANGTASVEGTVKSPNFVDGKEFNIELEDGKEFNIELEDEVKYSLEINKTKIGGSLPIDGVQFKLEDEDGNSIRGRTKNGKATLEGLQLNKVYTLTETAVPATCEKNGGEFKFKVVRENGSLTIQTITNTLLVGSPVLQDEQNVLTPVLKANVQNEIKYELNLLKQDGDGNKLPNIQFTIKGEGFGTDGSRFSTNKDGKLTIYGLSFGKEYTLEETKAEGYYLDLSENNIKNTITFKVERTANGIDITTWKKGENVQEVGTPSVTENELIASLDVVLKNEKIPTYNLKLVKVNKDGEKLQGAQFKLTSLDTNKEQTATTNEDGEFIFEDLYEYKEGRNITGEYTLEETFAPEGYVLDNTKLKFRATRDATTGGVQVSILEGKEILKDKVIENAEEGEIESETKVEENIEKDITSDENTLTLNILNKPIFKLTKKGDKDALLPNAKFIITNLDGNYVTGTDGNIVGKDEVINGRTYKVVVTNDKGELSANLPEGTYKATEVQVPEGYVLPEKEKDKTYYFGIGKSFPGLRGPVDSVKWAKSIKSDLISEFKQVIPTDDDGVIAVGRTYKNTDIDGNGTVDKEGKGYYDGIIVKYNKDGNIEWSKTLGGANNEAIFSIAKTQDDGYVFAGYTDSTEVYLSDTKIATKYFGNEDGIVVKINDAGDYVWSQSIGGIGVDRINGIAVSGNDVAVVGSYTSAELNTSKEATSSLENQGAKTKDKNAFIIVFSGAGAYKWSQNIGGTAESPTTYVTADTTGVGVVATDSGFAVAVNFLGIAYLDTDKTTSVTSNGKADSLVIEYDGYGSISWYKQIGSKENDNLTGITKDKDGNIIAVGSYAGEVTIGESTVKTKGKYDGLVVKYSGTGDYITHTTIGGTADDTFSSVYVTKDGGLLLGGWYYSSSLDLNGDGTNEITQNSGICDGLVMKLDSNYNFEWYDSIKGTDYDEVTSVVETKEGDYVAVGDYESTSVTICNEANKLTNSKYTDGMIVRYETENIIPEVPEIQELEVHNELKQYNITTEIGINSENIRTGGTITGEYNDDYEEVNNIKFVESIKHGYNSTQAIEITPNEGYIIKQITINGENIQFITKEDGSYKIPEGYFKDVKQDYHIIVTFVRCRENLTINKVDKEDNNIKLANARFEIEQISENTEEGSSETEKLFKGEFTTNSNGQIIVENLPIGKYKITEIKAPNGYILNSTPTEAELTEDGAVVRITNEKKKPFVINKIDKDTKQGIKGVLFKISGGEDFKDILATTDENGQISKVLPTGKYTITELIIPNGYKTNSEPKEIEVTENVGGSITIENEKIGPVKITKLDKETNQPIANTKFAIYSLNAEYIQTGFAKDINDNFIGVQNEDENGNENYTVTSNENGEIVLEDLPNGNYKIVEVDSADNYYLEEDPKLRTWYFTVNGRLIEEIDDLENEEQEDEKIPHTVEGLENNTYSYTHEVKCIEDLVKLANKASTGCTFKNERILLTKTLDFKEDSSYQDPGDIRFGDYNGVNGSEGIKNELNNTNGCGFKGFPSNVKFEGIFDGNGYELKNIYMKDTKGNYAGIFGKISSAEIKNLGILGGSISSSPTGAALVTYAYNSKIINCYNTASVKCTLVAGIVYEANNSLIENCYNEGKLTGSPAGGIIYMANNCIINNCYNTANITSSAPVGGIIAFSGGNTIITNCYNTGNIETSSSYAGGISGDILNGNVTNCYNTGKITSTSSYAGGISGNGINGNVTNCYNIGNVTGNAPTGGISGNGINGNITNCFNTGKITGTSAPAGGIAYSISGDKIIRKCYNTGDVQGSGGAAGIIYSTNNCPISNCYNEGNITTNAPAGGIAQNITGDVINCYNKGKITSTSAPAGGIAYSITGNVTNCYNEGIIETTNAPAGGIAQNITGNVINCYNIGKITSTGAPAGGITQGFKGKMYNCYNTGEVQGEFGAAGISQGISSNSEIVNCYNKGNIYASAAPAGGIWSGTISDVKVMNCYNAGTVTSEVGVGEVGGSLPERCVIKNVYYLSSFANSGIYDSKNPTVSYDKVGEIEAISADDLKLEKFVNTLNMNRKNINTSLPLCAWEQDSKSPKLQETLNKQQITITNEKAGKVAVHHLLEGTGPEYKDENGAEIPAVVLAEDEILKGKIEEEYTTSPNMKIEKYTLIKGEDGEYVIPKNAVGEYAEEEQHVYYYYTQANLKLTVHHYLEGTEDKVPLGKDENDVDKFAEDIVSYWKENETYETKKSEEVLKAYDFVSVVGDEKKVIVKDEVVTYYYKIKKHNIITRVEVPETRDEEDKGGSISGEGLSPYEIVDHGSASKEDNIIVTPDDGYRIKEIRLVSTSEEGNKTESKIYINGKTSEEEENAEKKYREDLDGRLILTKFENMTEDKEVIVVFEPDDGKVIVHHYIEGTENKIYEDQITIDLIGKEVETLPVKVGNYVLVGEEPEDSRNVTITKDIKHKIYYYQKQYKITTDVIEHDEEYKNGDITKNVKGGTITTVDENDKTIQLEDGKVCEYVLQGRASKNEIKIVPSKITDKDGNVIEEYEIVSVIIKDGKEDKEGQVYEFKGKLEPDGSLILKAGEDGIFSKMQSDKHIEVEFRKKSKVIVKHLEFETEKVLYPTEDGKDDGKDYEEILGIEGKEFDTDRKIISNYIPAQIELVDEETGNVLGKTAITDENTQSLDSYSKIETDKKQYANGTMFADEITIIYWYKRAPSEIIVRHIEINEKGEEKELSREEIKGEAGFEQLTNRSDKYDEYISVDGPKNSNKNVTVMKNNEDSKTVVFAENETLEVWYYYEKQYNITTEVKPHEEIVINKEGKEEKILKDGGTISKEYEKDEQGNDKLDSNGNKIEAIYETVLSRGDSKKEIVIKPDDGYRIKSVIKQKKVLDENGKEAFVDEKIFIEDKVKEDGTLTLEKGSLTDVQNDYKIIVEFEKIPTKVVVQYKDAYTKESIHEDKTIDGFINDEYKTTREEIENYIIAEVDAIKDGTKVKSDVTYTGEGNEKTAYVETETHLMTEDVITVTYWYTREFNITTKVKEHEETKVDPETGKEEKAKVKGGEISGDSTGSSEGSEGNKKPYEVVIRGETSKNPIVIKPNDGYRIKTLTINEKEIEIKDLIKEDRSIELPFFKDMQEDKEIVVEFERIPAKVIVKYLEEGTEKPIYKAENGKEYEEINGFVSDKYTSKEKDIKYYEFIKEKYPENSKGVMTEDEITVKYYYKQMPFNMKVEKDVDRIVLNGKDVDITDRNKAKVEIKYKDIKEANLEVIYKIKVTNTEKVEGTSIIEEKLPDGFEFVEEKSDKRFMLEDEEILKKLGLDKKDEEEKADKADKSEKASNKSDNGNVDNEKLDEDNSIKYVMKTDIIKPGESKEYEVCLRWKQDAENKGKKVNVAKIAGTENTPKFEETTKEDNEEIAIIEIKLTKTLPEIIQEIKDDVIEMPKTGQARIVYIAAVVLGGVCIGIIVWRKKKK